MDRFFQSVWYENKAQWFSLLLLPLSWLFASVAAFRRGAYRSGLFRSYRVSKPVIVVGNITVGGTGKTPITIWLAEQLQARGVRVGIVLRGYGGQSTQWPRDVTSDTSTNEVGDEAVLLATRTGALVVAGPDRVAAANRAIERGAQIILCDDGLQHYRLQRDIEIAVIDERRGLGNRRLLPAGPLREPASRLDTVDIKILNRRSVEASQTSFGANVVVAMPTLKDAVSITSGRRRPLDSFHGTRVHAVAGIGNPQAFFDALTARGIEVEPHPYPDHARLNYQDIFFGDGAAVLMTEKDAVKCGSEIRQAAQAAGDPFWAVPMDINMDAADVQGVQRILDRVLATRPVA